MERLQKLVKLVLASGYLKNTKPLSFMIVSKAGNGKTEIISSFDHKRAKFITDLTYMGALDLLKSDPLVTHFIIPDFLKLTMKKRSTSNNLLSLFNALTEDGVGNINMYNFKHNFENRLVGIIIATTKASFDQHKKEWENTGFTSRCLICTYDYKDETIEEIFDYINQEKFFKSYSKEKLKGFKSFEVKTDPKLNKQLNKFANKKFRSLKQLQTLAKCNALLNIRKEVNQKDIDEVIDLCQYLNLNYTKI